MQVYKFLIFVSDRDNTLSVWCAPVKTGAVEQARRDSLQSADPDRVIHMPQPKRAKVRRRLSRPVRQRHSAPSAQKVSPLGQQIEITVGSLVIDRQRRSVQIGSQAIHLTPIEFSLLCVLAMRPGEVHRREELLQRVWGGDIHVTPRTVDVHMSKLRQKLGISDEGVSLAETVWGVGYRLRG